MREFQRAYLGGFSSPNGFFSGGGAFRPMTPELGCAPCKAMQKQKEANEEFARRFGIVRDPRTLPTAPLNQ